MIVAFPGLFSYPFLLFVALWFILDAICFMSYLVLFCSCDCGIPWTFLLPFFDALTELGAFMRTEVLCISVLRVALGPRVNLTSCKSALNPPVVYSTDRSKAVVPVLVLLFVVL